MDVAKVDRDVAHVAYFCKYFQWYVASVLKNISSVSDVYWSKCFI
jgi:hypothetical protein